MYVSDQFICITIPKCGSRSMQHWCEYYGTNIVEGMHGMSADPADYKGRFVFAPIRSPYSRALSLWKHTRELYDYDQSLERMLIEFMVEEERGELFLRKDVFRYAQIQYMKKCEFPFNEVPITWVRMENFNEELGALPIPSHNPICEGKTAGDSWTEIPTLSPEAIRLVNEWASEDFEVLGYDKL